MLRKVMLSYGESLVKEGTVGPAVQGPLEELSPLAVNSRARLKLSLDLLNALSAASRTGGGTSLVLREMYNSFPDSEKDIAAYTYFSFIRTDPGSLNVDRIRASYLQPEGWLALKETIDSTKNDHNTFEMLKKGLMAIDGYNDNDKIRRETFGGALSYILLNEAGKRLGSQESVVHILDEYDRSCNQESRGRLNPVMAQEALNKVISAILHDAAAKDPSTELVIAHMETLWKDGDAENNRKIIIETLDALQKLKDGTLQGIDAWIAEKVLGSGEGGSIPSEKVEENDDYIIIGDVIMPKNKKNS